MKEAKIELAGLRFSSNRIYGGEGEIKILAEDIKRNGLINPITVKPSKDDGNDVFEVIAGRRRVLAVTLLGWKDIPSRILVGDEIERAEEIAGAENINRLAMHPLDEAAMFKKYVETGETIETLAKRYDRSKSAIWQRIQLLDLTNGVKDIFREGKISLNAAAMFTGISAEKQVAFCKEIKTSYYYKNQETIPDDVVKGIIARGQDKRLHKCIAGKECQECKTRTFYTDKELFPDMKNSDDFCLDGKCYMERWNVLLFSRIKSVVGENKGHSEAELILTDSHDFIKLFGKGVTVEQKKYAVKKLDYEKRQRMTEKASANSKPCFEIELEDGKLRVSPRWYKEPPKGKEKPLAEKVNFTPIVNLLDLPAEEKEQVIASLNKKIEGKQSWQCNDFPQDIQQKIKHIAMLKIYEHKAKQPLSVEKEMAFFIKNNFNTSIDVAEAFFGTKKPDGSKLKADQVFAVLNAEEFSPHDLPDVKEVLTLNKSEIAEWAGMSMEELRKAYKEAAQSIVPKPKAPSKPELPKKKKPNASGGKKPTR